MMIIFSGHCMLTDFPANRAPVISRTEWDTADRIAYTCQPPLTGSGGTYTCADDGRFVIRAPDVEGCIGGGKLRER